MPERERYRDGCVCVFAKRGEGVHRCWGHIACDSTCRTVRSTRSAAVCVCAGTGGAERGGGRRKVFFNPFGARFLYYCLHRPWCFINCLIGYTFLCYILSGTSCRIGKPTNGKIGRCSHPCVWPTEGCCCCQSTRRFDETGNPLCLIYLI